MMHKQRKYKLCPVCGQRVYKMGQTTNGRIYASCGDAFYPNPDKLGREYWGNHNIRKAA
jgi:NADH pyrophosphatase NudC (nudix superfamily)